MSGRLRVPVLCILRRFWLWNRTTTIYPPQVDTYKLCFLQNVFELGSQIDRSSDLQKQKHEQDDRRLQSRQCSENSPDSIVNSLSLLLRKQFLRGPLGQVRGSAQLCEALPYVAGIPVRYMLRYSFRTVNSVCRYVPGTMLTLVASNNLGEHLAFGDL